MSITRSQLSHAERELLAGPLAVQVSSVDALLRPRLARCWGVELDDQGILTVALIDAQTQALRAALTESRRAAVNVTQPVTLYSLQFKGEVVELAEPDESAREMVRIRSDVFADSLGHIGIEPAKVRGAMHRGPARYLRLRVREMFNQTPGPSAGNPLRPA